MTIGRGDNNVVSAWDLHCSKSLLVLIVGIIGLTAIYVLLFDERFRMGKKSIYDSGTTKGSAPRTSDYKKYSDNWDKIFEKETQGE